MHLHSLNGTLRAVAAIIRVVVDVARAMNARYATVRGARRASADARRRLLAIIERLDHATGVWTCLW